MEGKKYLQQLLDQRHSLLLAVSNVIDSGTHSSGLWEYCADRLSSSSIMRGASLFNSQLCFWHLEWKLNWPQTADGCGRYEPKKKWRKE